MNKLKFEKIFSGEFLGYISQYRKHIQEILNEHEVVIFMARKAVCFYRAMVYNSELIVPPSCIILSSRIIDYNVLERYKGKKIAVIDDVVVKGKSLELVLSKLNEHGLSANILVVACDDTINIKKYEQFSNFFLYDTFVVLEQKDIFSFSGMITEYIEASMCPFNIDYPIYTVDIDNALLHELLYNNHAIDITTSTQQNYGITNNVIYLNINHVINNDSPLFLLKTSILKIRILSDGVCTIAIPFVLFPEITNDQLEQVFSIIKTHEIITLAKVDNELMTKENKMKIANYLLSEALIYSFFKDKDVLLKKQEDNDVFQFTENANIIFDGISHHLCEKYSVLLVDLTSIYINYNKFEFPNLLASCYQAISEIDPTKQQFINSDGVLIKDEIIITHNILLEYIKSASNNSLYLASCAVDIFIDRGMIVPSIVHTKNNHIIRAYKLGEYSKLTRSQIEAFAAMLYQYQDMIDDSLNKTEFEKLCVLFFKMAVTRGIFPQQEKYEDGCYSICYSLYGPRVSTGNVSYKVEADSALITDFCSPIDSNKRLVTIQKNKYIIHMIGSLPQHKNLTTAFAFKYSSLRKVFLNAEIERKKSIDKKTSWNMYVHTYIQYITLQAIGNNKKNQFLSLCAELYQVIQLPENFFDSFEKILPFSKFILSGINSGLWKYSCFLNDVLDKTTQQIFEKDNHTGTLLLIDPEQPSDKKEDWQLAIYNAGMLLYKIAFLINEVLKVKNKMFELSIDDEFSEQDKDIHKTRKTIFTLGYYYNSNKNIKELRHSIEETVNKHSNASNFDYWCKTELKKLKQEAKLELDICDVILDNNSPSVTYFTRYLIVYSKNRVFPKSFSCPEVTRQELMLDDIEKKSSVKIFGLQLKQQSIPFFSGLYKKQEQESLKFIILDLNDLNFATIKQKNNRHGKGSFIALKINELIEIYEKAEAKNDLLVVSQAPYPSSIKYNNIQLESSISESQIDLFSILNKLNDCFPASLDGNKMIINLFTININNYLTEKGQELSNINISGNINGSLNVAETGGTFNFFNDEWEK